MRLRIDKKKSYFALQVRQEVFSSCHHYLDAGRDPFVCATSSGSHSEGQWGATWRPVFTELHCVAVEKGGGGRNSIESDMELPWKDDGVQNFECSEVETRANSRKACDQSPGSVPLL